MSGEGLTPPTDRLRLFRGLAVPSARAEVVAADIRANGLAADRGRWRMIWDPAGEEAMSGQEEPLAVCACGDFAGAAYYASHHNRSGVNDTPLVAEFESDMEGVAVDGRDFLYPLFQQGSDARARDLVERAFGLCARTYLDKAWGTTDQRRRIDLCRDARHDTQVVCGHHSKPASARRSMPDAVPERVPSQSTGPGGIRKGDSSSGSRVGQSDAGCGLGRRSRSTSRISGQLRG